MEKIKSLSDLLSLLALKDNSAAVDEAMEFFFPKRIICQVMASWHLPRKNNLISETAIMLIACLLAIIYEFLQRQFGNVNCPKD